MTQRAKRHSLTPVAAAAALAFSATGCTGDAGTRHAKEGTANNTSDTWNAARLWTTYALNSHPSAFDIDVDVESV